VIDLRRTNTFFNGDDIIDRNHFTISRTYIVIGKVAGFIAVGPGYLTYYLILFAIHGKITQAAVTECQLQGLRDISYRNTQLRSFVPVDSYSQFRLIYL